LNLRPLAQGGAFPGCLPGGLAGIVALILAGCTVLPKPLETAERERLAADSQAALFAGQEPLQGPLTLPEAMARAIKYQADYRQRQMEVAATAAQLDVAKFDLLPKLTVNAGYSTRNNDAFGFGFTPDGQLATNPTASTERTRDTLTVGFAWNLLDFGVSYYRARQLADQVLIMQERRRKAVQTLVHDVRVAWWRAEAAQRLLPAADALLAEIDRASEKTRVIEARKLLPPLQTATLRRALLDLSQQISFRRYELAQARVELAALVNVPPGTDIRVAAPLDEKRDVLDLTADLDKLEALALRARPEIAEEGYRARISEDEARKALVGLLPGLSLDIGRNWDGNRFLVNNTWTSAGFSVLFNLVKVFSLPALKRSEEAQKQADTARRLAMAMAILAQTRIAAVRYTLVADEFLVWDDASRDDNTIVKYLAASAQVGIDTELELIRARARALASSMNRDLAYANVQASVARLYNSVGYDAVPPADEGRAMAELSRLVDVRFTELEHASFSPRVPPELTAVAIGEISGTRESAAGLMRTGAATILGLSKVRVVDAAQADVRLNFKVSVADPKEGRRFASVGIEFAGPGPGRKPVEFRTTLSEPVDDEQWRALGEGAVYRALDSLVRLPVRKPSLRPSLTLQSPEERAPQAAAADAPPGLDGEPFALRVEQVMHSFVESPAEQQGTMDERNFR
jgi:outer membrane protein TolC